MRLVPRTWGEFEFRGAFGVRTLMQIVLVASGSALGGLARWSVGLLANRFLGTTFPFGTLIINVTGSFFLGWFLTVLSESLVFDNRGWLRSEDLRLLVGVGFTGAYTTFSTFEYESQSLLGDGRGTLATTYMIGSVVLGLVAVRAGVLLARQL